MVSGYRRLLLPLWLGFTAASVQALEQAATGGGVVLDISTQGIPFGEARQGQTERLLALEQTSEAPDAATSGPGRAPPADAEPTGALRRRNRQLMEENTDLRQRLQQAETRPPASAGELPQDMEAALERAEAAEGRADDFAALLEKAQQRQRELEAQLKQLRASREELEQQLEQLAERPPTECPEPEPVDCPPVLEPQCPEPEPVVVECPEPAQAPAPAAATKDTPKPRAAATRQTEAESGDAPAVDLEHLREQLARALENLWYLTAPEGQITAIEVAERLAPYEPDLVMNARQRMVQDYLDWGNEKFQAGDLDEALLYGERASRVIPDAGKRLVAVVEEERARRMRHRVAGEPTPDAVAAPDAEAAPSLPEPAKKDLTLKIVDGLRGLFD